MRQTMRALATMCLSISGLYLGTSIALADSYVQQCAGVIKYDETKLKSDLSYKLAFYKSLNSSNYAEKSQNGSLTAEIYSVPATADYNQFQKEMAATNSLITQNIDLQIDTDLLQRAVSKDSVEAYKACLNASANAPLTAYVSASTDKLVIVNVHFHLPPSVEGVVSIDTSLANPTDAHKEIKVLGTADRSVFFNVPAGADFAANFNLSGINGEPIASTDPLIVPAVPHIEAVPEYKQLMYGVQECKAGDHKSTRGNLTEPTSTFTPDPGYTLLSDHKISVISNPTPGSGCSDMASVKDIPPPGAGDAYGWKADPSGTQHMQIFCEGSAHSTHNQACAQYQASVTEVKYTLRKTSE
ncbi:hypothetical protein [Rhizobium rhizogenes]|uniref:hypothetical protein n=1 Tax=Rhizobium rhizogenes TaxID=359 RepID=UPI00226D458D|nr:hypothetical protein [Rhizobium rhizogenes]